VLVPVYNEAAHVDELLRAIHASPVKKEIIIVDDGSTDGTREKLRTMALADDVTVIFHEKNYGKGAAIRTALEYARGEYILIQDSDLEYDPQDYAALLRPLERGQADVVYGVRPDRPERGLRFFLGAKLLTHLTNLLYGAGIHDEATCYKVFRREVVQSIPIEENRFGFEPEITVKVARRNLRIYEVGISYWGRTYEEGKKIGWKDGVRALYCLLKYSFKEPKTRTKPAASTVPAPEQDRSRL